MELSAASAASLLLCLCLVLLPLLSSSQADKDNNKILTSSLSTEGTNFYSEGAGLSPKLEPIARPTHSITSRKNATPSSSFEHRDDRLVVPKTRVDEKVDLQIQNYAAIAQSKHNGQPAAVSQSTIHDRSKGLIATSADSNATNSNLNTSAKNLSDTSDRQHEVSNGSSIYSDPLTARNDGELASVVNLTTPSPKRKSKPGLTFDVEDLPTDKNGNVIITKENLVGSGPSFDYVIPIVIAMLAVPLVAVIGAFLYKKSRDFWDRRHYRRMDFLIDGMYND